MFIFTNLEHYRSGSIW